MPKSVWRGCLLRIEDVICKTYSHVLENPNFLCRIVSDKDAQVHDVTTTTMANSKSLSCRNIGWWQFALVVVCLGGVVEGRAQVANDDCASAQDLDIIIYSPDCFIMGMQALALVDSTIPAVPNFPYPVSPGPCTGFTTVQWAPANDLWYRFQLPMGNFLICELAAVDSVQITWWQGPDCGTMTALTCLGIPAGSSDQAWVNPAYDQPIDTIYMQVSSTSINTQARFSICYLATSFGSPPISWGTYDPTPVICTVHEVHVIPASGGIEPDGGIEVVVTAGNAPFAITWSTGDTSFTLDGLEPGNYPFAISDAFGCVELDTAVVDLQTSVPEDYVQTTYPSALTVCNNRIEYMSTTGHASHFRLFSMQGALLAERPIEGGHVSIPLHPSWPSILLAVVQDAEGRLVERRCFIINE